MTAHDRAPLRICEPYSAFAEVYDRLMTDMPYGEWLGWLEAYWASKGRPSRIVDLGCGTGTLAIPLAQSGIGVTGIDLSADMLAVARRKEASVREEMLLPGTLLWLQGDMREWKLPEQVDGAVSMCDCLNYLLEEEDLLRTFRRTCDGLAEGGLFLFDMHHPNQLNEYMMNEPFCQDDDELSYIWTCSLNEKTSTIAHRMSFFIRNGDDDWYIRRVETHRQRFYPEETVLRLLREAGFSQVQSYADFSFEPIDDASTLRMFFAAVRPRA